MRVNKVKVMLWFLNVVRIIMRWIISVVSNYFGEGIFRWFINVFFNVFI